LIDLGFEPRDSSKCYIEDKQNKELIKSNPCINQISKSEKEKLAHNIFGKGKYH